jgi:hypothetical protein
LAVLYAAPFLPLQIERVCTVAGTSRFHWSKDFVEHLRAVHFALAVVSVILIVADTSGLDGRLNKALTQIEQIASFEKQWSTVPQRIYDQALLDNRISEEWDVQFEVVAPQQYVPNGTIDTYLDVKKETMIAPSAWKFNWRPFPAELSTLSAFRDLWNQLNKGEMLNLPEDPTYRNARCVQWLQVIHANAALGEYTAKSLNLGSDQFACYVGAAVPHDRFSPTGIREVEMTGSDSSPFGDQPIAWVEFETELPSNVAKRLIQKYHARSVKLLSDIEPQFHSFRITERYLAALFFRDWKGGDFATAFPELNSSATGVMTLDINDALHRIEAEAVSSQRDVSILGFSLALSELSKWGGIVLLSVQLYFWLHLHELASRIEPNAEGWDVAWIGLYSTRLSFVTALITCSLLPVAAAGSLALKIAVLHVYYQRTANVGSGIVISLSALLAFLSCRKLYQLRESARKEPKTDDPV